MADLQQFRTEVRAWLTEHCPQSLRQPAVAAELSYGGRHARFASEDAKRWLELMAVRGWTVPDWPKAYGGGGLSPEQTRVLKQEMKALGCRPPLIGHGIWMLGPALLEFGSEAQKREHIPKIARGERRWCQGYSEPAAGSDLASLQCRAQDKGDYFEVTGTKIWTTDADKADWIFCLVRTDTSVKKQAGISFLLIDMQSPGISVRPITLISGMSDFCETYFDAVKVPKENLVGELNQGWSIAKQLLVHERTMMSDMQAFMPKPKCSFTDLAAMARERGELDPELRTRLASYLMDRDALEYTQQRIFQETRAEGGSAAAMIMKYVGTEADKRRAELEMALLGSSGLGWVGEGFKDYELQMTRQWLTSYAVTIGGGTSEIQLNIIAKHLLGLPD